MAVGLPYETARMNDAELIAHFDKNPEDAYAELLKRFSPVIIRMVRRFMYDQDEVMEVYTSICERLRSRNFKALKRFRVNSEITPWLSVVVANACRDRFRKKRSVSMPQTVLKKLDDREKLVFKYYYQEQLAHEDICETIIGKHDMPCTSMQVARAIEKIDGLLSINKRWHLLMAINQNRPTLSIEDLEAVGFQTVDADTWLSSLDVPTETEIVGLLNSALTTLDPEDQLLVLLRFEHGMKASEIAEAMGFENHKYVYTRLRTIVNRLRRRMEETKE